MDDQGPFSDCVLEALHPDDGISVQLAKEVLSSRCTSRQDLVGVQGPYTGSGRSDGVFWQCGAWFVKSRLDNVFVEIDRARDALARLAEAKARLERLAPEPTLLMLTREACGGQCRLWTVAPTLKTVRDEMNETMAAGRDGGDWYPLARALEHYVAGLVCAIRFSVEHCLSLDASPANFAMQGHVLRYIDDDLIMRPDAVGVEDGFIARLRELGEAPVAVRDGYVDHFIDALAESGAIRQWHSFRFTDRFLVAARLRPGLDELVQDIVQKINRRRSKLGVATG